MDPLENSKEAGELEQNREKPETPNSAEEQEAGSGENGNQTSVEEKYEAGSKDADGVDVPAEESELEKLKKELEQLHKDKRDLQEQMLRVRAEGENFRKRLQREKDDFVRFAREGFIRDLLPVKDNLERALAHAEDDPASIVDGVKLTLEQFASILQGMGVEEITSRGEPFDPARHEAMAQVESDDCAPNTVVDELQKGYTLHGRLLRPAMVTVAKAAATEK
jgi:molecular chaperone GrpE